MKKTILKDVHDNAGNVLRALVPQAPEERSLSASLGDHAIDIIKAVDRGVRIKQIVDALTKEYSTHQRSSIGSTVSRILANRKSILKKHELEKGKKVLAQPVSAAPKALTETTDVPQFGSAKAEKHIFLEGLISQSRRNTHDAG